MEIGEKKLDIRISEVCAIALFGTNILRNERALS
jgi:hypothetical protein